MKSLYFNASGHFSYNIKHESRHISVRLTSIDLTMYLVATSAYSYIWYKLISYDEYDVHMQCVVRGWQFKHRLVDLPWQHDQNWKHLQTPGLEHFCNAQSQWQGRWQQKYTWDAVLLVRDTQAAKWFPFKLTNWPLFAASEFWELPTSPEMKKVLQCNRCLSWPLTHASDLAIWC
jgi:hypothetical protein